MKLLSVLLLALFSCSTPHNQSSLAAQAVSVPCAPARSFGAIPDDGNDDRAALQATIDACAGSVIYLERGRYNVMTPFPRPTRMYAMLVAKPGTTLVGFVDTVIEFSGNNGQLDWRGIQLADNFELKYIRLESRFDAGTTVEQTHLMRTDGPARGIHVSYVSCFHPAPGSKSGDCIQFVGYPPAADGSKDKRIWDVEIDHVVFEHSDRSGIAIHSGLNGTMKPDGHSTTRFHDNVFLDISDQPIDGEGSGSTDTVEIDHNVFRIPSNLESGVSIQIQASSHIFIHDNVFDGRGIDLYGCDACKLSHNTCRQSIPGATCALLRKVSSDVVFSNEDYTREASAGPGAVISIEQKLSAPERVTITDSKFTQHTNASAISTLGIAGVNVFNTSIVYDGSLRVDAMSFIGSGTNVDPSCKDNSTPSDYPGVRTTDIHVRDVKVEGPHRAVVGVSGSYCGTGTVEITRATASGALQGLRCENVSTGSKVLGPITLSSNNLPPATCAAIGP